MLVYLKKHELRKTNYTFAVDLLDTLKQTDLTAKQFTNMIQGLTYSYDELWFQKGEIVDSWVSGDAATFQVGRAVQFFTDKVENRFTIVRFKDDGANNLWVLGAYTHAPFQIPKNWDDYVVSQRKEYYTFEIGKREFMQMTGSQLW
jgi:hypothetical protein